MRSTGDKCQSSLLFQTNKNTLESHFNPIIPIRFQFEKGTNDNDSIYPASVAIQYHTTSNYNPLYTHESLIRQSVDFISPESNERKKRVFHKKYVLNKSKHTSSLLFLASIHSSSSSSSIVFSHLKLHI